MSISTAIKVVQSLPAEEEWQNKRVSFGKDRTAYVPKNQHQQQQHNMTAAAMGSMALANYGVGFASPALSNLGGGSEIGESLRKCLSVSEGNIPADTLDMVVRFSSNWFA